VVDVVRKFQETPFWDVGWIEQEKGQDEVSQPSLLTSALRRPVGEIDDARAEGLRVDELQRLLIAPVLEQTLPAPHDYGMEHEPEFVEEAVFKQ
jgi:hypothetical protein